MVKIKTARLKEIIKEEIEEVQISGQAAGGSKQGPETPEVRLTARTINNVASALKQVTDYRNRDEVPQSFKQHFDKLILKFKTYLDDISRDLPVRPHGQGIPIDNTKYVEAPVQQELTEMRNALDAAHEVFLALMGARGAQPISDKLVDAIDKAWQGGRYRFNVPGATVKKDPDGVWGGGLTYSADADAQRRNLEISENLQKIIDEEIEAVLTGKK